MDWLAATILFLLHSLWLPSSYTYMSISYHIILLVSDYVYSLHCTTHVFFLLQVSEYCTTTSLVFRRFHSTMRFHPPHNAGELLSSSQQICRSHCISNQTRRHRCYQPALSTLNLQEGSTTTVKWKLQSLVTFTMGSDHYVRQA